MSNKQTPEPWWIEWSEWSEREKRLKYRIRRKHHYPRMKYKILMDLNRHNKKRNP